VRRRESLRTSAAWHAERRQQRRRFWAAVGLILLPLLILFTMPACTGAGGFTC
jgi:hypothetical protein